MKRNIILLLLLLLLLIVITSVSTNVEPFSLTGGIKGGFKGMINGFKDKKKKMTNMTMIMKNPKRWNAKQKK